VWGEDGWLYLEQGGQVPAVDVPAPAGSGARTVPDAVIRHDFDDRRLPLEFQWLRSPDWQHLFSLDERPGHLRLYGRESIGSWFEQALVARRQEDFDFRAQTRLDFVPATFQQAAGLVHYYNRHKFHFLAVTHDDRHGRVLTVMSCPGDWPDGRLVFPLEEPVPLPGEVPVALEMEVRGPSLRFGYDAGDGWRGIGPELDASVISDEGGRGEHGSFTGAFVGMAAFDTGGGGLHADFDWFSYRHGASS
jgi:xylan 1,4-beta-xylosidase